MSLGPDGGEAGYEWFERLPCAITVFDRKYKTLGTRDMSAGVNKESGGKGANGDEPNGVPPPRAPQELREVIVSGKPHASAVERMVFQGQWKRCGRTVGQVEIYCQPPEDLPNLERK